MNSIVYAVQLPTMRDRDTGRVVNKYDLGPAEEFGEVRYLLTKGAKPFNPEPVLRDLAAGLAGFTAEDYLLLVGNPCFIGWATAIALGRTGGSLQLLQWSGGRYRAVSADLTSVLSTEYPGP